MSSPFSINHQIMEVLRRIIRSIDLQSRRLMEQCGLTGPQLITLEAAAQMGPVSASALARAVHLSPPTLTGILDRLEKRGFVERFRDTRDRRSWLVTITPQGHRLLESEPSALHRQFVVELAKLADWEQSQMLSTLQRIAGMMETPDADELPVPGLVAEFTDSSPPVPADSPAEPLPGLNSQGIPLALDDARSSPCSDASQALS